MNETIPVTSDQGPKDRLRERIRGRTARIGVCGLGYVGLPLCVATAQQGFKVSGFDINEARVDELNGGRSGIGAVSDEELQTLIAQDTFSASQDPSGLADCDVILICVPTPLTRHREPDLQYVRATAETIAANQRPGQLVVLESTTYPGTTNEVIRPILEQHGLKSGSDFFLGFSPEREDPGNRHFDTASIPKVVSGDGDTARELAVLFYDAVVDQVVPVSTNQTAEAVKLTENIFRAVNIALVNELKVVYDAMGIDVWEVIDAAKTKPFGYMPFYPGPGLGGHCIPIDPFYLTWKSREYDLSTRFIELAGEINVAMPRFVVDRLAQALNDRSGRALAKARILLIGMAYKKNVEDIRESPSFKLMQLIEQRGATVDYHDPFVDEIPGTREHPEYQGRKSVSLTKDSVAGFDAVLISTDHDTVDYALIANAASLIVDTRNVFARLGLDMSNVVKA